MEPWSDESVVIETSCGAIVVDLFTADNREGAQWIIDLVRSNVVNGATAVGLLYGGLLRFECPAVPTPDCLPSSSSSLSRLEAIKTPLLDGAAKALQAGMRLRRGTPGIGPRIRIIGRQGLVLLPRRPEVDAQGERHSSGGLLFCNIVLTSQNFDFLENDFVPVGQVYEGLGTLQRMRYRCSSTALDGAMRLVRPTRLIRVKQAAMLSRASQSSSLTARAMALNRLAVAPSSGRLANLVIVDAAQRQGDAQQLVAVRYNPHCNGGYLSSDDDDEGDPSKPVDGAAQRALHQHKLDETRALMLNVLDGITDSSVAPPDTVLFVCKLNPLTTSEGLMTCFTQFGKVISSEVLRDPKGNSRCFAFVEFAERSSCDRAFQKMDKALVDDCRIHVDYSQSMSKVWATTRRAATSQRKRERD